MANNFSDISNCVDSIIDKVVEVCPAIEAVSREFALKRIGMSEALYRSRGEAFTEKMVEDIVTGCVAEFAVYAYLVSKGYNCSKPDLDIHPTGSKSYSADLTFDGNYIHVKSQTKESADRYGQSWLFQEEDKALALPSETGYGFFCIVDGLNVTIKASVYLIDILEKEAIGRPKIMRYGHTKKAIYLEQLETAGVRIDRF